MIAYANTIHSVLTLLSNLAMGAVTNITNPNHHAIMYRAIQWQFYCLLIPPQVGSVPARIAATSPRHNLPFSCVTPLIGSLTPFSFLL